jgi:hypothetical protein
MKKICISYLLSLFNKINHPPSPPPHQKIREIDTEEVDLQKSCICTQSSKTVFPRLRYLA